MTQVQVGRYGRFCVVIYFFFSVFPFRSKLIFQTSFAAALGAHDFLPLFFLPSSSLFFFFFLYIPSVFAPSRRLFRRDMRLSGRHLCVCVCDFSFTYSPLTPTHTHPHSPTLIHTHTQSHYIYTTDHCFHLHHIPNSYTIPLYTKQSHHSTFFFLASVFLLSFLKYWNPDFTWLKLFLLFFFSSSLLLPFIIFTYHF